MIVRIIPETEAEKQKMKTIEHQGVKEFMVFGNKKDADGYMVDFHEWSGRYRYLIGSLNFFQEVLHDERRERDASAREQETYKTIMANKAKPVQGQAQVINVPAEEVPQPPAVPTLKLVQNNEEE